MKRTRGDLVHEVRTGVAEAVTNWPTVRISAVEAIPFGLPYRVPTKLSIGSLEVQKNVLVRIEASDGTVGFGESQPVPLFQGCGETYATITALVEGTFASLLIGRNPFDTERLMFELAHAVRGAPWAQTAVADALFDLQARLLDVPLHCLLGGSYRKTIPVRWSLGIDSPDRVADSAARLVAQGYRHLKLKIESSNFEDQVHSVAAIRDAVGDEATLTVDGNADFHVGEAITKLRRLEEYGLQHIEQPLPSWDLDGMASLALHLNTALLADESVTSIHSALAVVTRRAASLLNVKLAKHGGLYSARKVAAIAEAAGLSVFAGGMVSSGVGAATAAHFFAATWNVVPGDFYQGTIPGGWLNDDIVENPMAVEDGEVVLPEGPGNGVEIDAEKLAKYRISA